MAKEERWSISDLVREAQRGSPEAFDTLVRRFRELMVAVARQKIGSREAAEDVVQAGEPGFGAEGDSGGGRAPGLLQAFRALPQLHDPDRFVPWLTVITRCRARRVGRRSRRHEPLDSAALESLLMDRGERPPQPAEECIRAVERDDVRAALSRLPRDQRTILRLYYLEEWSVRRIADHLSLPASTVKWRLHQNARLVLPRAMEFLAEPRGRRPLQRQLTMHGAAGAIAGAILSDRWRYRGLRRLAGGGVRCRSLCGF